MKIKHLLRSLLLLVGLYPPLVSAADVMFLTHKKLSVVTQLAQKISQQLGIETAVKVVSGDEFDSGGARAVVLVGPQALANWKPDGTPAIAVFISRSQVTSSLEALQSALYLEPPVKRQIRLAKAVIGDDVSIGMLAQEQSSLSALGIGQKEQKSFNIRPYYLSEYDSINRAMVDLLDECQVLVGQYDTDLYSAANIKNILITAYRQNRPLVGPSSAYIRAGALATTYSDLDDVVKRLSEILVSGLQQGRWPAADYNPYFKVRFNEQVARSLNLTLPNTGHLVEALKRQESR